MSLMDNIKLLPEHVIKYYIFYITFPTNHIWANNYIKLINCRSSAHAYYFTSDLYGNKYSMLYNEHNMDFSFYPNGQVREYNLINF